MFVDGDLHEAALRGGRNDTPEYVKLRDTLERIQNVNQLRDPIYTLSDIDGPMAKFAVISTGHVALGTPYRLAPEIRAALRRVIAEGIPAYTDIYVDDNGSGSCTMASAWPPRNNRSTRASDGARRS